MSGLSLLGCTARAKVGSVIVIAVPVFRPRLMQSGRMMQELTSKFQISNWV